MTPVNIVQTIPAQDYVAVFIDVDSGHPFVIPIILWATVRDEKHGDSIVGAVISDDYTPQLILLSTIVYDHFWHYEHKDAEWDNNEVKQEVEFCRGWERDSLTDDFLSIAIKENIISEELADEFSESLPYPFISSSGKPIYRALAISNVLESGGLASWKDRPEDNQIIKKIYNEWFSWNRNKENFSFLKDES